MSRLVDVFEFPVEPYELEPGEVIEGTPRTAEATFTSIGDAQLGVWEITPGTVRDVEKDEAFVVLSGEGTITFADGEVTELKSGSMVRLNEGESTVWEIRTTLRKVYLI
jgi:uncharacterized cupin superfamily protein